MMLCNLLSHFFPVCIVTFLVFYWFVALFSPFLEIKKEFSHIDIRFGVNSNHVCVHRAYCNSSSPKAI